MGDQVELEVDSVAVLVDELNSVAEVTVHEAVAVWDAAVAHEDYNLMDGLWVLGEVVPEGC